MSDNFSEQNQNKDSGIKQNNKQSIKKYWKFMIGFFAVIIGVFILYIAGIWGKHIFNVWQTRKTMIPAGFEEKIKQIQQEDYEQAMADTYGGKTPQETLQMYIDAVEKGDYELASKYFIEGEQKNELERLKETNKQKNIDFLLKYVKQVKNSSGYSDGLIYTIEKPIFIEFKKYPNGIWKIIEI